MKLGGIIVGIIGAALFVWHLANVLFGMDRGTSDYTHHLLSLVGGVLLFAGIWLYVTGRKRPHRTSGTPLK